MPKLNNGAGAGRAHRQTSEPRKTSIIAMPATISGVAYSVASILLTTIPVTRTEVMALAAVMLALGEMVAATATEIFALR